MELLVAGILIVTVLGFLGVIFLLHNLYNLIAGMDGNDDDE